MKEDAESEPLSRKKYSAREKGKEKAGDAEVGIISEKKMKGKAPLAEPFTDGPFGRPFMTDPFGKPITFHRRPLFSELYSVAEKKKTKVVDSNPEQTEPEKNYNRPQSSGKYSVAEKKKTKVVDAKPKETEPEKNYNRPQSSGKYSVAEKKKTKVVDAKPKETEPEKNYNRPQSRGEYSTMKEDAESEPLSRKKYSAREKGKEKAGDAEVGIISEKKMKGKAPLAEPFTDGPFGRPFMTDPFGKPITFHRRPLFSELYSVAEKKKTKVVDSNPEQTEPEKNYNRPQSSGKYSVAEKKKTKVVDAKPKETEPEKNYNRPQSSGKYSVAEKKKTKVVDAKPKETEPEKNYNRPQSRGEYSTMKEDAESEPLSRKKYSAREKGKEKAGDAEVGIISEKKMKGKAPLAEPFTDGPFGRPFMTDPFGKPITFHRRPLFSELYSVAEKKKTKVVDSNPEQTEPEKNYNRPQSSGKYSVAEKKKTKVVDAKPKETEPEKNYNRPQSSGKYSVAEKKKTKVVDAKPKETEPEKNYNRPQSRKKYSAHEKGKQKVGDAEPDKIFDKKLKEIPPPPSTLKKSKKSIGTPSITDPETPRKVKPTFKWPPGIRDLLYPHQIEGVNWLFSLHRKGQGGGILCDDMGLGKTLQICSFVAGLFISNSIKKVIIVSPTSTMDQWKKELSVVGLSELTKMYTASCKNIRESNLQYVMQDKGIIITTYALISKYKDAFRNDCTWDYMFLDEGHIMKNSSTSRSKSIRDIASHHRIIITGTPVQNNLKEFRTLMNFCSPEVFGENQEQFVKDIEERIIRGSRSNATEWEIDSASKAEEKLQVLIKPYLLRRRKEVLPQPLPVKDDIVVWIPLSSHQEGLYRDALGVKANGLEKIAVLKNICNHSWLVEQNKAVDMQESSKIPFIESLVTNLTDGGHKVVLFSSSVEMLNIIEDLLAPSYRLKRIDGNTTDSERTSQIDAFQKGEGDIFLITSGAGGVGITLTMADRVIIIDPHWNPSVDNQSADRVYRIGQQKNVVIYRLITCNTVEETMYKRQLFKTELTTSVTKQKMKKGIFNQQELEVKFTPPEEAPEEAPEEGFFSASPTQRRLFKEHHLLRRRESLISHVMFLKSLNVGISFHDEICS